MILSSTGDMITCCSLSEQVTWTNSIATDLPTKRMLHASLTQKWLFLFLCDPQDISNRFVALLPWAQCLAITLQLSGGPENRGIVGEAENIEWVIKRKKCKMLRNISCVPHSLCPQSLLNYAVHVSKQHVSCNTSSVWKAYRTLYSTPECPLKLKGYVPFSNLWAKWILNTASN